MLQFHRLVVEASVLLFICCARTNSLRERTDKHAGTRLALKLEAAESVNDTPSRVQKTGRHLQQNENESQCQRLRASFYNSDRESWRITDAVQSDGGLAAVMNCTRENDVVELVGATTSILQETVVINTPITITTGTNANQQSAGTRRMVPRKTKLSCPDRTSSVFDIRAPRVVLANLVIQDCNMTKDSKSPIYVRINSSITLKNVEFKDNVHHSNVPSTLFFEKQSGSSLILQNVAFLRNRGGSSVLKLPQNTMMTDIEAFGNSKSAAVFKAPRQSRISIFRLNAVDNRVTVVKVRNSTLFVLTSNFTRNELFREGSGALSILEHSVANVTDSRFEYNKATDGGALFVTNSTIDITRSVFNKQEAKNEGGACFFKGTIARLSKCNFTENKSDNDGGSIRGEGGSLSCWKCQFRQNVARNAGGCLKMDQSKTTLAESDFVQNKATFGSVFRSEDSDNMTISRCVFEHNVGTNTGGVCYLDVNVFTIEDSVLRNNTAGYGGAIYAQNAKNGSKILNTHFEKNEATLLGGACHTDFGDLALLNVTLTGNRASLGGAFYFLSITVRGSELLFSGNVASEGGAFVALSSKIDISQFAAADSKPASFGMKAAGNVADNGGGAVHASNTTISISEAEFTDCSAVEGGAIRIVGKEYRVNISNSKFLNNRAEESGGSVYGRSIDHGAAYLNFKNVSFRGSKSSQGGGGCYLSSVKANFEDCHFSKCTSLYGGAVFLRKGSSEEHAVKIAHSTIAQCWANQTGGGIFASTGVHVTLETTNIRANQAPNGPGGGMAVAAASLDLSNARISENRAQKGGGIALLDKSEARIRESKIFLNSADEAGGISMEDIENASIQSTTIKLNEANGKGGGLMLEGSVCVARRIQVSENQANKDGGGLVIDQSSSVLCSECCFEDNEAITNGGGISVKSGSDKKEISAQLDDCVFRRNKAGFGGGIYYLKTSSYEDSHLPPWQLAKDGGVVLINTHFINNHARRNGSAVHSNLGSFVSIFCPDSMSAPVNRGFLNQEDFEKLRESSRVEEKCRQQVEGTDGQPAFSTYVRMIELRGDGLNSLSSNLYQLSEIVSGEELGQIIVAPWDDYGHYPALSSRGDMRPRLTGDLVGGVFAASLLEDGSYSFSGIRTNLKEPGQYNLTISFSDADNLESMTILVEVRGCHIGELKKEDGVYCELCGDRSYNFFPNETTCAPCPLNANCTGNFVRPEKGYWMNSPCHNRTVECMNPEACDGMRLDDVDLVSPVHSDRLYGFTSQLEKKCPVAESDVATFRKLLCREGHRGVLCGECSEGRGLTSVYKCVNCLPRSVLVLLLVLAAGWIYFVVIISIRGNHVWSRRLLQDLIYQRKCQTSLRMTRRPARVSKVSLIRHSISEQLSDQSASGSSSTNNRAREQLEMDAQKEKEALLAKWQMCEIFKILVNFLQATSIAVLINVEWKRYVLDAFRGTDLASGATVEAVSNSVFCLSAKSIDHPSVIGTLVVLFGPFLIALTFAIYYCAIVIGGQVDKKTAAKQFGLGFFAILYFNYSNITRQSLNVFLCIGVPDDDFSKTGVLRYVWAQDPSLECGDGPHRLLIALAAAIAGVFSLGFPIACSFIHYAYRQLTNLDASGSLYDVLGFTFRAYDCEYRYWESLIMLRKACLSLVAVFSYRLGGTTQGLLASAMLITCLFFHTTCRPFRDEFGDLNKYESYSLIVSCMTYLLAGFFVEGRSGEWVRVFLSVFLLGIISGYSLLMLYALVKSIIWFLEADLHAVKADCSNASLLKLVLLWAAYRSGYKKAPPLETNIEIEIPSVPKDS